MASILDKCAGAPRKNFAPGTVLLSEGETPGGFIFLPKAASRCCAAIRRSPSSAKRARCSAKCRCCSTGRIRQRSGPGLRSCVFVFDDAESFLKSNPEIAFLLGRLLAERLNAATTYLVDLKRQFEGHGNHLGMVGEVLESLIHQQHEDFTPGPEREADPRL